MENKNHQQENFKSTYQSLVNSARILFVEKGYQAVSIDEISGKALVTKGAFYHHFKNKKHIHYSYNPQSKEWNIFYLVRDYIINNDTINGNELKTLYKK